MNWKKPHIAWKSIARIFKYVGLVLTFLLALLLVGSAYGGYIDPAHGWFFPILTLAFPLILLLAVVVAVLWFALTQWRIALVMVIAILASWPMVRIIVPLNFFSYDYSVEEEQNKFTVLTFNVHGFHQQRGEYFYQDTTNMRYILDQNADVVLLQEASLGPTDYINLHAMESLRGEIDRKYPYKSRGYHDLVIMSKYPYTVLEDTTLKQGQFGSVDDIHSEYHFYAKAFDVEFPNKRKVRFVDVHLQSIGLTDTDKQAYMDITEMKDLTNRKDASQMKNSVVAKLGGAYKRRSEEAKELRNILDATTDNVILCGDFNDTPGSYVYRTICGSDLKDAYTERGVGPTYTYHENRFYFRIDHILYRGAIAATEAKVDKIGHSDHYPMKATFVWKDQ